jgi:hypothetical protein
MIESTGTTIVEPYRPDTCEHCSRTAAWVIRSRITGVRVYACDDCAEAIQLSLVCEGLKRLESSQAPEVTPHAHTD